MILTVGKRRQDAASNRSNSLVLDNKTLHRFSAPGDLTLSHIESFKAPLYSVDFQESRIVEGGWVRGVGGEHPKYRNVIIFPSLLCAV
jgi:hypothetical protein